MSGGLNSKKKRKYLLRLMEAQSGLCAYCPTKCVAVKRWRYDPAQATIDHVIPLSRGGTSRVSNLVMACRACNEAKDNYPAPALLHGRVGQLDGHLNSNQADAGSSPVAPAILASTEAMSLAPAVDLPPVDTSDAPFQLPMEG